MRLGSGDRVVNASCGSIAVSDVHQGERQWYQNQSAQFDVLAHLAKRALQHVGRLTRTAIEQVPYAQQTQSRGPQPSWRESCYGSLQHGPGAFGFSGVEV